MIGGKHEQSYDIVRIAEISFEYKEFKNLILLQDSLKEEYGTQLSTSLLMTRDYFENYQLVLQYKKVFQLSYIVKQVDNIRKFDICVFANQKKNIRKFFKV